MLTRVFSPEATTAPRRRLRDFLEWFAAFMGVGPFSNFRDQELSDHHWAAQSGLLRAIRNSDLERVRRLSPLVAAMEREMRRRGLV